MDVAGFRSAVAGAGVAHGPGLGGEAGAGGEGVGDVAGWRRTALGSGSQCLARHGRGRGEVEDVDAEGRRAHGAGRRRGSGESSRCRVLGARRMAPVHEPGGARGAGSARRRGVGVAVAPCRGSVKGRPRGLRTPRRGRCVRVLGCVRVAAAGARARTKRKGRGRGVEDGRGMPRSSGSAWCPRGRRGSVGGGCGFYGAVP